MAETIRSNEKTQQLLIIDNQIILHRGSCKLQINTLSKILLIIPENEDYKLISIPFNSQFVKQNDILCVFKADKIHNLAISFKNATVCNKVYNCILKGGQDLIDENESKQIFMEKFILPLCNTISSLSTTDEFLKTLFHDIKRSLNNSEKESFEKFMESKNLYHLIGAKIKVENFDSEREIQTIENLNRKRNHDNRVKAKTIKKRKRLSTSKSESENVEILTNDNNLEKNQINSRMQQQHKISKFIFKPDGILKPPNFLVSIYHRLGKDVPRLFIFTSKDKKMCYEFTYNKSRDIYTCLGCNLHSTYVTAKVCKGVNGKDYIKFGGNQHVCESKEYKPYNTERNVIIESPNFKVISFKKNEVTKTRLIIFSSEDLKLCYEYFRWNFQETWLCSGCYLLKKSVSAKIFKGEDGKDFVRLGENEHICEWRKYEPEKFISSNVIKKPNYEIFELTKNGKPLKRLIIFTTDDKKLCYEYGFHCTNHYYNCIKCLSKRVGVRAYVRNDENGIEYISLAKNEHICQPINYQPEKYKSPDIVKSSNFKITETPYQNKIIKRLLIFNLEDKNLCYEYSWNKQDNSFYCLDCRNQYKFHVDAKLFKNEDSEDYLELSDRKHKCQPRGHTE